MAAEQQLAALEADVLRLRTQRDEVTATLAYKEAKLRAAYEERELPAGKRLRIKGPLAGSQTERRPWRRLPEVQQEFAELRAAGKLVPFGAPGRVPRVYVDGCFDMMHSGHMNAVRQARLIANGVGGVLVVGVHSDAEILKNKGPPVMHDSERMGLVAAVKWVEELIFDTPYQATLAFLDSIDCDFCVHGDDMSIGADGQDAYGEAKKAGRIKIVKRTEGVSTTDLVGRLLLMTRACHDRSPALRPALGVAASELPAAGALEPAAAVAAAGASSYTSANISSSGVSQFLATTWRLRQFSNGRTAPPGTKVVYVSGAFDLLHAGHVAALYEARRRGDFLIVGLHDDPLVAEHHGRHHPVASLHERALCVLALGCVDEVILGAPWAVSADLMRSMGIALVVGGVDDNEATAAGGVPEADEARYRVPRELGVFQQRHAPADPLRLEQIVQRIVENRARYEKRNTTREKKELAYMQEQKTYVQEL
eukprot:Transcript_3103.p1 GENE.Transcript_3103~~Transcript_3103.p1  ORF type:complete len:481 (-),score=217.42 Transcript_3103:93-1535(-)